MLSPSRSQKRGGPRHPLIGAWVLAALLLACATGGASAATIAVAGGEIIPVSTPGTGYANDVNHPLPYMVFLPKDYATNSAPCPLVVCLHGDGEVGNGSSNGTLVASTSNQLAYLLGGGVLPLITAGSTYFGDHHVIVLQPQSDQGNGSAFNLNRLDLTVKLILATYNVDRARIYATGYSAGGGGVTRFAYGYASNANYHLAVVVPIANIQGVGTTYTDFSKMTGTVTWFVNDSNDTIAPPILQTGRIWAGYGDGWLGGISRYLDQAANGGSLPGSTIKTRCLTTHPDVAAINAGGFNTNGTIPAAQVTNTYTGVYDSANAKGWTWSAGETFVSGVKLAVTLRQGGGHSGWAQTYGAGSPNLQFWNWLLAQHAGGTTVTTVAAVAVSPAATTVPVGQSRQFTATALDPNGVALSPQPGIQWTCSAGGVITATGQLTVTVPTAKITVTATVTGAKAGSAVVTPTSAGTVSIHPVDTTTPKPPFGYLSYLPAGYNPADTAKMWPLVIYLPDVAQAGDGTDTAANGHQLSTKLTKYGPLYQVENQHWDFPAIVIVPQEATNWTKPANVKAVVEYAKATFHVDVNRITMTGNLEGANGALRYALAYPKDLAGVLAIEASTPADAALAATIKDLPLWAVHSFADPAVARTISIGWTDCLAVAQNGGTSDVMATYPSYGGDRNHYAVDSDATTHKPLNANGLTTTIAGAVEKAGATAIAFPGGTSFGSSVFGMWGGSAALPFAQVAVAGDAAKYVSARGYPTSLTLTAAAAKSATATLTITTPVGYNATAWRGSNGVWGWNRDQHWDQAHPDQQVLTLFWYQDASQGWTQTWANQEAWNWLLNQIRAPSGAG
jgi:predicted peptidase